VHTRPDNPAGYLEALAGALSDYPFLLVAECCDPRTGLARRREQPPTVASIIAWCDERLDLYRVLASARPERCRES